MTPSNQPLRQAGVDASKCSDLDFKKQANFTMRKNPDFCGKPQQ
jgi:hypothetical protein